MESTGSFLFGCGLFACLFLVLFFVYLFLCLFFPIDLKVIYSLISVFIAHNPLLNSSHFNLTIGVSRGSLS